MSAEYSFERAPGGSEGAGEQSPFGNAYDEARRRGDAFRLDRKA